MGDSWRVKAEIEERFSCLLNTAEAPRMESLATQQCRRQIRSESLRYLNQVSDGPFSSTTLVVAEEKSGY